MNRVATEYPWPTQHIDSSLLIRGTVRFRCKPCSDMHVIKIFPSPKTIRSRSREEFRWLVQSRSAPFLFARRDMLFFLLLYDCLCNIYLHASILLFFVTPSSTSL